jgi:DNA invertase Pin-like site-specific DNA recombinase
MRRAVAIYARISQDRDGDGLGVGRQLADCRAEARRRGWAVAQEYVDDDVSAYSGKPRPAYREMLADLRDGRRDAVIVWHLDRLHRRPIELEEFVQTCSAAGVTDVVTLHGDFNLGSGDGLLVARLLSAVAANESDSKRRRGKRKSLEIAQSGRPHGGGPRAFGYQADKLTPHPTEADIYRQLADRALAGESLNSLSAWLDAEGVRTVGGKPWRTQVVRSILTNPRYWGVRVHQGTPIGPANWPPLITPHQGEQLLALLTNPSRRTNRSARRYLLSGLCRCALCGTKMFSVPRYATRRYLCRSGNDFGGCGRMAIAAEPLETLIAEAVVYRLDTPELADALIGKKGDTTAITTLRASIDADVAQLEELTQLYAQRSITAPEWMQARKAVEARLADSRRTLSRAQAYNALDEYVGNSQALRRQWVTLNLDRQRAIIRAILDHARIHPAIRRTNRLDPARVEPVWRL